METKTLVIITAYNRLKSLTALVKELHKQDPQTDIVIFDDHSPENYKPIADNIQVFRNPEHYGKHGYWNTTTISSFLTMWRCVQISWRTASRTTRRRIASA